MKPFILYATRRTGGTLSSYGHACAHCRKPFVANGLTFAETRVAAERCCSGGTMPATPPAPVGGGSWVDVHHELPDDQVDVLIYDPSAERGQHIAYRRRGSWYVRGSSRRWTPTYWMTLPCPEVSTC